MWFVYRNGGGKELLANTTKYCVCFTLLLFALQLRFLFQKDFCALVHTYWRKAKLIFESAKNKFYDIIDDTFERMNDIEGSRDPLFSCVMIKMKYYTLAKRNPLCQERDLGRLLGREMTWEKKWPIWPYCQIEDQSKAFQSRVVLWVLTGLKVL